jgi:hypothetical protein
MNKMFFKIAPFFLFLILSVNCFAQDDDFIPFIAYWSVGDTYDFEITKVKRQKEVGQITKNDSTTYVVTFEVLDSTETSYRIKWSFNTDLSSFNIPESMRGEFSKYEKTEVIYETSEMGEFRGIKNWEEIAKNMNALFAEVINNLDGNKVMLTEVLEPMRAAFNTKEGIEQLVFKELLYFHFLFGLEYSVTEVIEYEDVIPNLFGGDPIRGDAKIYVKEVDFDNNFCVMIKEGKLNPKDMKKLIESLFKRLSLDKKMYNDFMKKAKFEVNDFYQFEFFYYPGVPQKIEAKRTVVMDIGDIEGEKIEITRIELIEN